MCQLYVHSHFLGLLGLPHECKMSKYQFDHFIHCSGICILMVKSFQFLVQRGILVVELKILDNFNICSCNKIVK